MRSSYQIPSISGGEQALSAPEVKAKRDENRDQREKKRQQEPNAEEDAEEYASPFVRRPKHRWPQ
jgi:hypothetical protein